MPFCTFCRAAAHFFFSIILTTSISNNLDNPQFRLETGLSSLVKADTYYSLFQIGFLNVCNSPVVKCKTRDREVADSNPAGCILSFLSFIFSE